MQGQPGPFAAEGRNMRIMMNRSSSHLRRLRHVTLHERPRREREASSSSYKKNPPCSKQEARSSSRLRDVHRTSSSK